MNQTGLNNGFHNIIIRYLAMIFK